MRLRAQMDFVLRRPESRDAEAFADFARRQFVLTFGHTYRPEDLSPFLAEHYGEALQRAEILDRQCDHWLGWRGEALMGFVSTGPVKLPIACGPDARELRRLYVAEAAKGAGLANALTEAAMADARRRGAREMVLGVWSENFRAQRFYARHGFEKVGEYWFEVGQASDLEFILRAPLAP